MYKSRRSNEIPVIIFFQKHGEYRVQISSIQQPGERHLRYDNEDYNNILLTVKLRHQHHVSARYR